MRRRRTVHSPLAAPHEGKPRTRAEAVSWVLARLSADQKTHLRSIDTGRIGIECHFGLGMWIRNELFFGNPHGEALMRDIMAGGQRTFVHPDEVSTKLLEDVRRALQATR